METKKSTTEQYTYAVAIYRDGQAEKTKYFLNRTEAQKYLNYCRNICNLSAYMAIFHS